VKEDASLGIVFTTLFALGVVLISRWGGQADLDPGCVLYGNIEFFTSLDGRMPDEVFPMMVILALIVIGIIVFNRQLLICTFDPALAVSVGIAAWLVHYGLMTALSLTIVASFEAVGAILAVALLVLPGATARLWTHNLAHMLWFSAAFGIIATLVGYWLSHKSVLNTSAGAAIVVAGFFMFVVSWLLAPRSGLISAWRTRRRLRRTIALENLIKAIAEIAASRIVKGEARAQPPAALRDSTNGSAGASPSASVSLLDLNRELHWTNDSLKGISAAGILRGWISRNADSLSLTPAGVARGEKLESAHLAWEAYLQNQLNLPADHVHDAAEWIEHYLEETDLEEIRAPAPRHA
jgi:manganese/zinc/iron transport system permease protein